VKKWLGGDKTRVASRSVDGDGYCYVLGYPRGDNEEMEIFMEAEVAGIFTRELESV
jgi:hypothetical protein